MLTHAIPAVTRALSGVLPPLALRQLTQALGNCNQTVVQRGDVVVKPDAWTNVNNTNGTYGGGTYGGGKYGGETWNINNYSDLLQNIDYRQLIDVAGDTIYGNQLFDFSVSNSYPTNSFYGGDTINNAGNIYYGDTVINNPPGQNGRDGRDGIGRDGTDGIGRDGTDGTDGLSGPSGSAGSDGRDGFSGLNGLNGEPGTPGAAGGNGRDGRDGRDGEAGQDGVFIARAKKIKYVTGGKCTLRFNNYEVISNVTFDPETCSIQLEYQEREEVVAVDFKPDTSDATFFGPRGQ